MIDVEAVGRSVGPVEESWTTRDCLLYALGVGAGSVDATAELDLTTECSEGAPLQVLPTFAVVVAARLRRIYAQLGELDFTRIVHGSQEVQLMATLPPEGSVLLTTEVTGLHDKGSDALIELATSGVDPRTGEPVFRSVSTLFVKGAGGWGGGRGPAGPEAVPDREPDVVVPMETRADQALLYRLSGDLNPLHTDPVFARRAGFQVPILHGLCTYGFTGRALMHAFCDSDASRFHGMSARFSRPVIPGDRLDVHLWRQGAGVARFRTVNQRGEVVLDRGTCTYGEPLPTGAGRGHSS
ncbi:MaoC/PaaZ C-terminal domain-containing protein [Gordonia polyisoprenivorans]|uniref:MaoC/PaaZ C-terminal domain-containing protein n=1 Tax=Gordonia polyisoprenivorans TaxID=84595 RepID=UPI001AD649B2|nr:MaoC/PaaZ C-terminal domain-containing protein [Gordonia polyisoprenivorans]QTI69927.1 MaoC family dehydratase N-terminal domain-containing protein [Gordonia polyisoprenivorans]